MTMTGPRLQFQLLFTLTLLLTLLSFADTSTQTTYGDNSTDETVQAAKHDDESGGGGDGGDDDGEESENKSQNGLVSSAFSGRLLPYVIGEYADDSVGPQATIRRQLLKVVEEEVSLYNSAAAYTWPDDHSTRGNRTKSAIEAGDEDNTDDDVGGDIGYDFFHDEVDENSCGFDGFCDNDKDLGRNKRDHPPERPQIHDVRGAVLLEKVEGVVSLGTWRSLGVHVIQWHSRLILAVLDAGMNVTLYAVSPGTLEVSSSPSFPGVHSCSFTVVPVDLLLVACISPNRSSMDHGVQQAAGREVTVYLVNEETFGAGKLAVKHRQSIAVEYPVDLEMWSRGHDSYLVIANAQEAVEVYSPGGEELTKRTTYHTSSLLYHWKEHYFDALQQRVLPGTNPHALTHFTIGRRHFVAMANFQNNKGQHNIESYIFQYSLEKEHLILFQRLATKGARHFASFTLGRHPFADTFLVVANFCEDDGGACNPYTRSSIYRFAQRKFVLFQEVATVHAVQWQAVQAKDTVLLAVAQAAEGVRLFQYDGWRFVAAPVQHYEGRFGPGATGLAATRWNGTFVLAVSNREPENSLSRPSDIFKLTFREKTWLEKPHREHHAWCEAARGEVARVGDLAHLIQQVISAPNASRPNVFTRHATIRGNLTVLRSSSATQVFVGRTGRKMPVMLASLTQALVTLEQEVERVDDILSHAVSFASTDPWPAELHLAHLSAGWASVDHVEAQQVNQRLVSFKDAVTLDEAGAQYLERLPLAHVEIQAPASITMLTGVPFSSYVTLSGRHTHNGHVTFPGNVSSAGLVAVSVDGVHITPKSVLTNNEYQYLTGYLSCQYLSADSLQVITINSIPLSPLLSTLVLRDGLHTVSGLVRVRGDLAYYGNLKVNLTTHLDVENPLRTDYTGLQVITGDHQVGGLATLAMVVGGRMNAVRVPADVFFNGSQYSYAVPSAAFRQVRSASLSVTRALDTITVSDGRLNVLLTTDDRQVTAPKTFSSLLVLRRYSSDVGARRRRWSSGTCGFPKAEEQTTPKGRSEALLVALRGMVAALHLLSFIEEAPQGILLDPGHNIHFFKLLTQNVPCAISSIDDDSCLKLHNILQEVEWINSTKQDGTLLSRKAILQIENNLKAYIAKEEIELRSITLSVSDLLNVRDVTRLNPLTRQDIIILNSLISVISNHELHLVPPDLLFNNCVLVCPAIRENMPDKKILQETCTPDITPIFKALRCMPLYISIIRGMWHLSTHHSRILETGVMHHILKRLLQTVRTQKHLRRQISAAAVCGVAPEGAKESLQMLLKYRQELHREAMILFVARIKREAPAASAEVIETTNGSSTTDFASTNERSTTYSSPSSITEDTATFTESSTTYLSSTTDGPIISSEDSPTFPSSTTENPTTFTRDSTSSASNTTQSTTVSNDNSTVGPYSTTDGSTASSGETTTAPASTAEDPITFTEGPTTYPSSIEDSTVTPSITAADATTSDEDSTTYPSLPTGDPTTTEDPTTYSSFTTGDPTIPTEGSNTYPSSTENFTTFPITSSTDWAITSENSTTVPLPTAEDTTVSVENLTTFSSPTTGLSTSSSETSTNSISRTTEDPLLPSNDSATTSAFTTQYTILSTGDLPASSSPDTTIIHRGNSTTALSSTTRNPNTSGEVSTTSSLTTEDPAISSESSTTFPPFTHFPPSTSFKFSTSEDSIISSETSTPFQPFTTFPSSTFEDSTIFSDNSSTVPPSTTFASPKTEDSSISSSNSITFFSTTEDSIISNGTSATFLSTIEDSTNSSEISTTLFSTPEDSTISSEISVTSASTIRDTDTPGDNSNISQYPVTEDTAISSKISTTSQSTFGNQATFIENSTLSLTSITEDSTTSRAVTHEDLTSTEGSSTPHTSTIEDPTTSLTSSPNDPTTHTLLPPIDAILSRPRSSFSSSSEGGTINGENNGSVNELLHALQILATAVPTEVTTPLTDGSEDPWSEGDIGDFDLSAIQELATTRPAKEPTQLTTDASEVTLKEENTGGLDKLNESKNQTTTRPSEVTTLITTEVSKVTLTEGTNGGLDLGAIKELATTRPAELSTDKTDFVEDTTLVATTTTENITRITVPVQVTTTCIDCSVSEGNSSTDTDYNVLSEVQENITTTNTPLCYECNEVEAEASVDESATVIAGIQGLETTLGEDATPIDTAVDDSTHSVTTNPSEEASYNVTTQTSIASSVGTRSSVGGATTYGTTDTMTTAVVSQDIPCAVTTESPATYPEQPLEVMIRFSAARNTMEVLRSVTEVDPMIVPLYISQSYENCSSLSLVFLQDSDHLMFLYPRLQMTSHYLFTVFQSQVNLGSTETPEYDVGLEGSMFDAYGFIIDTLKKFVLDPIKFLETLNSERLQEDFEFLDFVLNFASSLHYRYWSNGMRYRALYLQRLLDVSTKIVNKLQNCFNYHSPTVSTPATETTTDYFVDPEEMPEVMHDLERQLLKNEDLIKGLNVLLNFTRDVQTLNPYLNPMCPSPHTIDPEFVAYAVEEVRETLEMILADELQFLSESNSSVLINQLLQLRDAMQLCLMADHLPPEIEAYLSLIYNKDGSPMARDSEKLLSVRLYYLLRATYGLVDYMHTIAEEHAIKHHNTSYSTEIPTSITDWDWDGLWLLGRLEGFSIYKLVEDARQKPSLPVHEEHTAYFDPAFSSYQSFLAQHKEKVRHLVFRSGLSTVSLQGHGVVRVQQHALALISIPSPSFTFFAPVTVVGSVRASIINGTPAITFVTLGGQNVLSQPFVFTDALTAAAHVRVRGEVNGVDLAQLRRSVAVSSTSVHQVLQHPVTFGRVFATNVVFANGQVNYVPLGDLVQLDQPAAITGNKIFTELTVHLGGTRVANLTAQYVSGVNVTDLFFNSLTTNPGGPQIVTGVLHLQHLVVRRSVTTHRLVYLDPLGTAYTLSLPSLASRVVLLHGDTIITGSLNFTGVVYISSLIFIDSFDRVSTGQFRDGWLLKSGDQYISSPVSFLNVTTHKATVVHGATLQGTNLTRLFGGTFLISQPVTFHATFTFRGPVWAAWTTVDGLVQGWDLGSHAVLQHSSGVVFTAAKTFLGNVYVSGVIMSGSRTDHCPYFPIRNFTIQGQVVANYLVNAGSAMVSGHKVTAEAATLYWLANTDTRVAVSMLRRVKLNYATATTVNGVDLQRLRSGLLQKMCGVQRLTGNFIFSSLEVDDLYTPVINSSFINGMQSSSLHEVLFLGGMQVFTGHPTFASLLSIAGSVTTSEVVKNGLRGNLLCRHSQRCLIHAPKTFQKGLVILGNLTVLENSLVQGVDLSRALDAWVQQNICGYIPGLTIITGNLIVVTTPSVISVGGLVDGVKVTSQHVMTRTGRQTMTKTILVNQPHGVAVESPAGLTALNGLFNGYNLSDAWRRTFLSNASVVIRAPVVFKEVVVFRNAVSINPQGPAPLPSFGDFKHFFEDFTRLHSLNVLSERAQHDRVREYWGWRVVQKIGVDLERLVPLNVGAAAARALNTVPLPPKHHLGLLSGDGSVPILQREPRADRYTHSDVVLAGRCTSGLVSYVTEGRNFLVTTHSCLDEPTGASLHHLDVTTSTAPSLKTDENLHVWELTPQGAELKADLDMPGAVDIQVVWPGDGRVACLVVVEAQGTDVVVLCERQAGVFVEQQRLNLTNPTKVSAAQHTPPVGSSGLTLAVADPGRTAMKGGGISLFQYNKKRREFYLLQEELLEDVVWVELVSRGSDLLLVAVTEAHKAGLRPGRVCIYRVDWYRLDGLTPLGHRGRLVQSATPSRRVARLPITPQLFPVQEVSVEAPSEARFLAVPSGGLHLYVISHSGHVTWFSQQGIHKFKEEGKVRTLSKLTLEVWSVAGGEWAPRMALAGGRCPRASHEAPDLPALVLEMMFRGGNGTITRP